MGFKLFGLCILFGAVLFVTFETTQASPQGKVAYQGPKLMDNTTLNGESVGDGDACCCNIPGCGHLCGCQCGSRCCASGGLCYCC